MTAHTLPTSSLLLILACGLIAVAPGAQAQTTRSGGGGANAQIMQQYQQLASERTALQADNAKLKADLASATAERDALKKERDALKAKAGGADASAARIAAATKASDEALAEQKRKTEEVVTKAREIATSLQTVEKDRNRLTAELAQKSQGYDACAASNVQLAGLIDEVLTRYQHQGWFHKATIDEPFTQITRNRVDNLVADYRTRATEIESATAGGAAAPKK